MKPFCTECNEPRGDNNFVPTKNLCRRCDRVFAGSRKAYNAWSGSSVKKQWPVTVRKIVTNIVKRVTLGESTDEMVAWLERAYKMKTKDAVSVVSDIWCNTEEGRTRRKQDREKCIMKRIRELWESHHPSNGNGTKRIRRNRNEGVVEQGVFFGKAERYRNGSRILSGWDKKIRMVESRRRVKDSGA